MVKLVGYARHQEPPHIIVNIPEDKVAEVLEISEVTLADLQESDMLVDSLMVKAICDLLYLWITDLDVEQNDWMLE